ncbi:MAG TPA: hypothetical protein VNF06_02750, partial [Candidatus Aquilonibacter sp.]|nr:hypothetical protein [Candidatus Aquilonibacter sp.]
MAQTRLQSAMEYLMTYGWAILIIAVVLGVLFQLGVFNFGRLSTASCLAQSGFICSTPLLNASGNLSITLGEVGTPLTITGVGCTNNNTQPTSSTSLYTQLQSNQKSKFIVQCPLSANKIGTVFTGYIWITYNQGTQSGLLAKLAEVTVPVTTTGPIGTLPSQYFYGVGGEQGGSAGSGSYYSALSSSGFSTWSSTTNYPMTIEQNSCVSSGGYIYCFAGFTGITNTNKVYYAPLTYPGIGSWSATTDYAGGTQQGTDCVASGGYVYCMAGGTFYAQLSSTGVGSWTSTNSYPGNAQYNSCFVLSGNIYCVGGGGGGTSLNYYAPLLNPGIGAWAATTSSPVLTYYPSCDYSSGYVYCAWGYNGYANTRLVSYAPVTGTGIGAWSSTTSLPNAVGSPTCKASNGYMYCITTSGMEAVYGQLTSTGIPSWTSTNSYPVQP